MYNVLSQRWFNRDGSAWNFLYHVSVPTLQYSPVALSSDFDFTFAMQGQEGDILNFTSISFFQLLHSNYKDEDYTPGEKGKRKIKSQGNVVFNMAYLTVFITTLKAFKRAEL